VNTPQEEDESEMAAVNSKIHCAEVQRPLPQAEKLFLDRAPLLLLESSSPERFSPWPLALLFGRSFLLHYFSWPHLKWSLAKSGHWLSLWLRIFLSQLSTYRGLGTQWF
jgi:hypothetical protein